MLSHDLAMRLEVLPIPENKLTNHAFGDQQSLWQKDRHIFISEHALKDAKRYQFSKYGKVFGLEIKRYLSICENYLFYFQQPTGGSYKGYCSLNSRYVEWHKTTDLKYIFLVSNTTETSIFYMDAPDFWTQQKEEIVKYAIRTNYYQEYNEMQLLGEGSFSKVMAVRGCQNGKMYAAKKIAKIDKNKKNTKKLAFQEKKMLVNLSSFKNTSHFVQFYEQNNEYVIIMEYIQGTDLSNYMRITPENSLDTIKVILISILLNLKDLHARKIIHRDIKPQNIHIDSSLQCKLIDFGLSLDVTNPLEKQYFRKCGTIGYMAPEVFMNEFAFVRPYSSKCDLFSLGIIAHMLLMGINPIKGKSYEQTYELNRQCKIILSRGKIIAKYGAQCFDFLDKLLDNRDKLRYSADQALNSPFLQQMHDKHEKELEGLSKFSISTMDEKRKLSEQSLLK